MRLHPLALAALLAAAPAAAQTVSIDRGNVVLTRPGAAPVRLTTSGRDREPVLSPGGGRRVAFVRGSGDASELWIVDVGGGAPRRLVAPRPSGEPRANLTNFGSPQFSLDGRTVYVQTTAWVTSGAVHAVNLATGRVRYVCDGNSLRAVPRGEYAGHLMVEKHRYFIGGGSYDWVWLVTPEGRDVGPIGESAEMFEETYVNPGRPR